MPGRRLVAVILKPKGDDSDRFVIPSQPIKLSRASGKVVAMLPLKLSGVRGKNEIQRLKDTIPDGPD